MGLLHHHKNNITSAMDNEREYNILTTHIVLKNNYTITNLQELKNEIRYDLERSDTQHATIRFDVVKEDCESLDC